MISCSGTAPWISVLCLAQRQLGAHSWWLSPESHGWMQSPLAQPGASSPGRQMVTDRGQGTGALSPEERPWGKAVTQRGVGHFSITPAGTGAALASLWPCLPRAHVKGKSQCPVLSRPAGGSCPGKAVNPSAAWLWCSVTGLTAHGRASVAVRKCYTNQQLYHKVPPVWQHPRGELFSNNQNLTYFQLV